MELGCEIFFSSRSYQNNSYLINPKSRSDIWYFQFCYLDLVNYCQLIGVFISYWCNRFSDKLILSYQNYLLSFISRLRTGILDSASQLITNQSFKSFSEHYSPLLRRPIITLGLVYTHKFMRFEDFATTLNNQNNKGHQNNEDQYNNKEPIDTRTSFSYHHHQNFRSLA